MSRVAKSVSDGSWDCPRFEYKRQVPKPPCGTIVWHPMPRLENGATVLDAPQISLVDETGRLHRVFAFELTQAELNARRVSDPERLAYLFDPYRDQTAAEPFRPDEWPDIFGDDGQPTREALTRIAASLTKLAMPDRVRGALIQREPGEEG